MKKTFLPIALMCIFGMIACNPGPSSSNTSSETPSSESSSSSSEDAYSLAISNKEALTAEWYAGGQIRKLEIAVEPAINVTQALSNGDLVVTSSDDTVINPVGLQLFALKEGTATITATYLEKYSDSVEITLLHKQTNKDRFGTEHEGTLEDPFTNEDALKAAPIALDQGDTNEYYFTGVVDYFYHTPGERSKGEVSWFMEPAEVDGESFEIYLCMAEDGTALTYDDIWANGTFVAYGMFAVYNSQYETSSAKLVSCEGNKPGPQQTIEATVSEALEVGTALRDGETTYDFYKVVGYVVAVSGSDLWLNGEKGFANPAKENSILLYGGASKEDLLKNAKVEVTLNVKNYHGTIENGGNFSYTVLEAGQPWVVPTHNVTVAEALEVVNGLADNETTSDLYVVSGVVIEVTGAYSDQYGNMNFTMADAVDGDVLTVFRVKTNAEVAAKVIAGAEVSVKGNLQKYVKNDTTTPELVNGDELSLNGTIEVTEPAYEVKSLADIIAAEDTNGEKVYVTSFTVKSYKEGAAAADMYGNLVATDGTNGIIVYGSTASLSALSFDSVSGHYSFKNPKDFLTNEATKNIALNDVLDAVVIRADYNGTKEICAVITSINGVLVSNGKASSDALLEANLNEYVSYTVEGTVTEWNTGKTDGTQYGNFYVQSEGSEHSILVYGSTATASSLAINEETKKVTFTNPKDFLTNELTSTIEIGSKVTLHVVMAQYKNVNQIQGVVLDVKEGGDTPVPPVAGDSVTCSFSDHGKRTSYSGTTKTWTFGEVEVINNKNSSNTACFDNSSSDHERFYAGSQVIIKSTVDIASIVITTTGSKNVSSTETVTGGTLAVNDVTATITANTGVKTIEFPNLSAQIRVTQIVVVFAK